MKQRYVADPEHSSVETFLVKASSRKILTNLYYQAILEEGFEIANNF